MARQPNNYKAMTQELQVLLADMQAEDLDVDDAIKKYERGQQLITELEEYLETAENKIIQHKLNKGSKAS
jgi:exodeoxyribonuclease VII small subunit